MKSRSDSCFGHTGLPGLSDTVHAFSFRTVLRCLVLATAVVVAGCAAEKEAKESSLTALKDGASITADTTDSTQPDSINSDTGEMDTGPEVDPTEALFDPDHLLEISIEIAPQDWNKLRRTGRDFADILMGEDCLSAPPDDIFEFYPAQVTVDGVTLENVGVRKKGFFGSLSEHKPSLKIKFSEYQEDQRLQGMERLTLNNNRQDPSHMVTCLTYGVFAAAGYPAPRCNFATVKVNGQALGVYTHVESVKKAYLRRHFEDDEGNLYEGTLSDFRDDWRGSFEKKTNKTENDWSDIDAAVEALQYEGPGAMEALGTIFDTEAFFTFWALEVLVAHWDGYAGNLNNYYIYHDPTRDRFVFLPWGPDSTFHPMRNPFEDYDYPPSVVANGILAHRLYKDDDQRQSYLEQLLDLLDTAWDETHLLEEVDRIEALISPHVSNYIKEPMAERIEIIKHFIGNQRESIVSSLEPEAPIWPHPLREPPCFTVDGSLDATFETTWGTLKVEKGIEEGDVSFKDLTVDQAQMPFMDSGVIAGIETEGPSAGRAVVSILLTLPDGSFDIFAFVIRPDMVKPNTQIPFEEGVAGGYHLRFSPPTYAEMQIIHFIGLGGVSFNEADTTEGGIINGTVKGMMFTAGKGEDDEKDEK